MCLRHPDLNQTQRVSEMGDRHEVVAFGVGLDFKLMRGRICYTKETKVQPLEKHRMWRGVTNSSASFGLYPHRACSLKEKK